MSGDLYIITSTRLKRIKFLWFDLGSVVVGVGITLISSKFDYEAQNRLNRLRDEHKNTTGKYWFIHDMQKIINL